MSREHRLAVGKRAMRRVYEHFEKHLFSTYSCILGKLHSQGVLGERLMHRIRNTADPDRAFHMLLDHLCEQDSDNLQLLVEVLRDSGTEECLPGHTMLAENLKYHLTAEKDAEVTAQMLHSDRNQSLHDPVISKLSHSLTLSSCRAGSNSTCASTPSQATLEAPSNIRNKTEPHTVYEYPELVSSLQYFFNDKLEEDEATVPACKDLMTPTQCKCAHPCHGMPLIQFAGALKGRTHGDLVILLWRLSGSDAIRSNLAYQLIRGKKQQLPIDLQIINVLGAVYATSDNAHLFEEALEWTKRPDCLNPVYLQCRLYYLLSICTLGSDKNRSEQYLKQAQELSIMCEPDFTMALIAMQEARTIFSQVEEHHGHLDEQTLMQINSISDRACEISRTLPDWMQPFAMVVTLLKMQLDARIALLLVKSGNHIGAIAAVSHLSRSVRELEKPATFCQLIPRQQATYHYIKAVVSFINKDRETALRNVTRGHTLYLRVNSVGPSHRIMELINDFN